MFSVTTLSMKTSNLSLVTKSNSLPRNKFFVKEKKELINIPTNNDKDTPQILLF